VSRFSTRGERSVRWWQRPDAQLAVGLSMTWGATFAHPAIGALVAALAVAGAIGLRRRSRIRLETDQSATLIARPHKRPSHAPGELDVRIIQDAADSARASVQRTLQLLRAALRAQSAVVVWRSTRKNQVTVRVVDTSSDNIRDGAYPADEGVLRGLVNAHGPTIRNHVSGEGFVPWYEADHPAHVIAIPLTREHAVVGYLVVDRGQGTEPFEELDADAVRAAAQQVSLAIRLEVLVVEAASAREGMAVLDDAAAQLNNALTVDDVCTKAVELVSRLLPVHACYLTAYDEGRDQQRVIHVHGASPELLGHTFGADQSIVSRALRLMECLPFQRRIEQGHEPVFGDSVTLGGPHAVMACPLAMSGRRIGTLTVVSRDLTAYEGAPNNQLVTVLRYISAALANALAYSDMVTLATTDGMTGLTNHRTFRLLAEQALARTRRSGRAVSLIMTDIDHFKNVNDSHGHAVGDEVIKAVAGVLNANHRDVDIAARYGGEEFAVLLEETDIESATLIAERLRADVEALAFDGTDGQFSVTLSLGVAVFAPDEMDLSSLIDHADQALYRAKRGGRNQVVKAPHRATDAA
jgi:two-component system cell cycle response regulator